MGFMLPSPFIWKDMENITFFSAEGDGLKWAMEFQNKNGP